MELKIIIILVCMAPDDIPDEVKELEICSNETGFVPCGEPFCNLLSLRWIYVFSH